MKYDFDKIIDRTGTHSIKVDEMKTIWGRTDLIPLWVADMDFETAPFVTEAVRKRCENGIFGYTRKHEGYFQSIIDWTKSRYNLSVDKGNINFVPGIVPGIAMAVNCFTKKGDKVLIQPPVYHPFRLVPQRNGREVVYNPLKFVDGTYRMDLDAFRRDIKGCKMFILCNPHNPGGVVWKKEELEAVADICYDEGVLVISDEIHADLTLPPFVHTPFANISEKARMNSITFMSPSKAFNMPGLSASHALIFNESTHERFSDYLEASELDMGHLFAFIAVEAAYSHGTDWLNQCLEYVQQNIDFVSEYLKENAPKIKVIRPEASYLVWLDCRELGMSQDELNRFFVEKAHLALNDGSMFGKEGNGFMRMNVGCPRSVLKSAMKQLKAAYSELE